MDQTKVRRCSIDDGMSKSRRKFSVVHFLLNQFGQNWRFAVVIILSCRIFEAEHKRLTPYEIDKGADSKSLALAQDGIVCC